MNLNVEGESMKIRHTTTGLFSIVALITVLIPAPVRASDHNTSDSRPIRLYASARFGPIGAVKLNSLSDAVVAIDGRVAHGEAAIWGGEVIKVIADRTVSVALDSIGQIKLARRTVVSFSKARSSSDDAGYDVLIASLLTGSAEVKLNPRAGAYIEAGQAALSATRGASFKVSVEDGRASLDTYAGVVRVQDQAPLQDLKIRVVDDLGRAVSSGSQLSVRARSTRQVQVQVTDKNDRPVPDLPVLFSLGDPCLGSLGVGAVAGLTMMQKTDKRGIAAVPLVAGAAKCAASIVAKVEGANASVTIQTNVQSGARFWNTQNTALAAAAAAAAGVGIGLGVTNSASATSAASGGKIAPVLPPSVKP
jgi:hypothetical protein